MIDDEEHYKLIDLVETVMELALKGLNVKEISELQ